MARKAFLSLKRPQLSFSFALGDFLHGYFILLPSIRCRGKLRDTREKRSEQLAGYAERLSAGQNTCGRGTGYSVQAAFWERRVIADESRLGSTRQSRFYMVWNSVWAESI